MNPKIQYSIRKAINRHLVQHVSTNSDTRDRIDILVEEAATEIEALYAGVVISNPTKEFADSLTTLNTELMTSRKFEKVYKKEDIPAGVIFLTRVEKNGILETKLRDYSVLGYDEKVCYLFEKPLGY